MVVGDYVWLFGGSDANGPVGAVQRGAFGQPAAAGLPANPDEGKVIRWDVNNAANLPVARTNAAGWGANGALYLAGGNDGTGPSREVYWAIPTTAGDIPEWKHLDGQRPAGGRSRGRRRRRQRPERGARRRDDRHRAADRERPRQHRAAEPVLPARAGRRDRARPDDRRRDRPAARLSQRGRRRHGRTSSC